VAIAGLVLLVGMLALMTLFAIAIGNNGRSKVDSTATMLTQAVAEQITAVLAGGGPGSITDCNGTGTTWTISSASGGANLAGSAIDFTQTSPPANFYMNFAQCNPDGTLQATYDVRWNIQTIDSGGTFLVTVGARPKGSAGNKLLFSIPVNMRAYVGGNN
jgi:Tfp pilus assembly protein PilV